MRGHRWHSICDFQFVDTIPKCRAFQTYPQNWVKSFRSFVKNAGIRCMGFRRCGAIIALFCSSLVRSADTDSRSTHSDRRCKRRWDECEACGWLPLFYFAFSFLAGCFASGWCWGRRSIVIPPVLTKIWITGRTYSYSDFWHFHGVSSVDCYCSAGGVAGLSV